MPTTLAAATPARLAADSPLHLDSLEFALTEEEIRRANILQFDPDAIVAPDTPGSPRPGDTSAFLTVPGYMFARSTWTRLAHGAFGGRPDEALVRFIMLRSRRRR